MYNLQQAVAAADEAYLIGMSNKGIYKRACKDLESAEVSVQVSENMAEVVISGETCQVKDPLWESTCSCPSRSVCRHLIASVLFLQKYFSEQHEIVEAESVQSPAHEELSDMLRQELKNVSQAQLKAAMGNQLKHILTWIANQQIVLEETSMLSGMLPDENQTSVRIFYPLECSVCSCHKADLCVHKAAVILAWQVKENIMQPDDFIIQAQTISEPQADKIRASAERSYILLCDILKWGLVRMPENMANHIETAAVQSHVLKMADAERMLRNIGIRMTEAREHRAVFRTENFLHMLCNCAAHLKNLQKEKITESDLGQFKKVYEEVTGELAILPVGQRTLHTGEYTGEIYYFLNLNLKAKQKFLTFSDIRPVFYETGKNRRQGAAAPWGLEAPLHVWMHQKMILRNAKISDGKLSASKDTVVVSRTEANLNCDAVRNSIYTDFRKLAVDMGQKQNAGEIDKLCFIQPKELVSSEFDVHTQQFQMQISDKNNHRILIQVRYKSENKTFIALLERISHIMQEHPEQNYILFCIAYFDNGRLALYPIEIYDFIPEVTNNAECILPSVYTKTNPVYADTILQLLHDVQNYLCELLQSGLQSAYGTQVMQLHKQAKQCGMQGLADMLESFSGQIEQFRHSMNENITNIMQFYIKIQKYSMLGYEKLEVLCALENMKKENKL